MMLSFIIFPIDQLLILPFPFPGIRVNLPFWERVAPTYPNSSANPTSFLTPPSNQHPWFYLKQRRTTGILRSTNYNSNSMTDTWVIVGASRGIGLEFVRQLLQNGQHVIAGVRSLSKADQLHELKSSFTVPERCIIEECDITSDDSIQVSLQAPIRVRKGTEDDRNSPTKLGKLSQVD